MPDRQKEFCMYNRKINILGNFVCCIFIPGIFCPLEFWSTNGNMLRSKNFNGSTRIGIIQTIPLEYQSVCFFVWIVSPRPLFRQQMCFPRPMEPKGGQTLACGWGGGGTQFGRLERKPGILYTLWFYSKKWAMICRSWRPGWKWSGSRWCWIQCDQPGPGCIQCQGSIFLRPWIFIVFLSQLLNYCILFLSFHTLIIHNKKVVIILLSVCAYDFYNFWSYICSLCSPAYI